MQEDLVELGSVSAATRPTQQSKLLDKGSNESWKIYLPCVGMFSPDADVRAKSWTVLSSFTIFNVIFWPVLVIFVILPLLSSNNSSNSSTVVTTPVFETIFPTDYGVTGIRYAGNNDVLIVGTTGAPLLQIFNISSFVYLGPIDDIPMNTNASNLYVWNPVFPNETVVSSSLYGPNTRYYDPRIKEGTILAVGAYYTEGFNYEKGFIYEGPLNGTGTFTKINLPPRYIEVNGSLVEDAVGLTIGHSVMGDYVVGDIYYVSSATRGKGYIYNRFTGEHFIIDHGISTTCYGIWQNNGPDSDLYTIVGGAAINATLGDLTTAYIENFNATTGNFSNYRTYPFSGPSLSLNVSSHFEGIVAVDGGFALVSDLRSGDTTYFYPYLAYIPVLEDGSFGDITWFPINNTITSDPALTTSANTVIGYTALGIYNVPPPPGIAAPPFKSYMVNMTEMVMTQLFD